MTTNDATDMTSYQLSIFFEEAWFKLAIITVSSNVNLEELYPPSEPIFVGWLTSKALEIPKGGYIYNFLVDRGLWMRLGSDADITEVRTSVSVKKAYRMYTELMTQIKIESK